VANPHDDPSFERVANTPTRGLGERTLEQIRQAARAADVSLWQAGRQLLSGGGLAARAGKALQGFVALVESLTAACRNQPLPMQVEQVLEGSGLTEFYRNARDAKAEDRVENLAELVNAAGGFTQAPGEDEVLTPLQSFLAHAALEAGEGQAAPWEDCVQLMTLHMAKGLEFPVVFLVGLEEGLFPNFRAEAEPGRLEEERRLAYVGITRARQQLYLSHAERRFLHGRESYPMPSRFIGEIAPDLIREIRPRLQVSRPLIASDPGGGEEDDDAFRVGGRVRHPKFGEGLIRAREGAGQRTRLQVQFGRERKWLVLAYARLESLD
ncbi:MAG: 3'-5' exonuclease, partial [Candidatus Competibacterales bacterium]|nr:3'-5' exonuclease [Candidatus Competibacterales bacterium]